MDDSVVFVVLLAFGCAVCGGAAAIEGSASRRALAFRIACEHGDGPACERAGDYYERDALGSDERVAREFYRRGCDASWPYACSALLQLSPRDAGACARLDAICSAPAGVPLRNVSCSIFNRECVTP